MQYHIVKSTIRILCRDFIDLRGRPRPSGRGG